MVFSCITVSFTFYTQTAGLKFILISPTRRVKRTEPIFGKVKGRLGEWLRVASVVLTSERKERREANLGPCHLLRDLHVSFKSVHSYV